MDINEVEKFGSNVKVIDNTKTQEQYDQERKDRYVDKCLNGSLIENVEILETKMTPEFKVSYVTKLDYVLVELETLTQDTTLTPEESQALYANIGRQLHEKN